MVATSTASSFFSAPSLFFGSGSKNSKPRTTNAGAIKSKLSNQEVDDAWLETRKAWHACWSIWPWKVCSRWSCLLQQLFNSIIWNRGWSNGFYRNVNESSAGIIQNPCSFDYLILSYFRLKHFQIPMHIFWSDWHALFLSLFLFCFI